jgi:hypothetical protein
MRARLGMSLIACLVACGANPPAVEAPSAIDAGPSITERSCDESAAAVRTCAPFISCECFRGCAWYEPADVPLPTPSRCFYTIDPAAEAVRERWIGADASFDRMTRCDRDGHCIDVFEPAQSCWYTCPRTMPTYACAVVDGACVVR